MYPKGFNKSKTYIKNITEFIAPDKSEAVFNVFTLLCKRIYCNQYKIARFFPYE